MQRQFDLSDNSSIRLTTSRYHTPSGRCIQRDYEKGTEAYYEDIYNRLMNGEMESVEVTVGVSNGNYVEIKSGLKDGDTVYAVAEKTQTATGLNALFSGMMSTQQVNRPGNSNRNNNTRNWNNNGGNGSGNFGGGMPSGGGSR